MAVDKGKQFEYAIMISALKRISVPTREESSRLQSYLSNIISSDVMQAAEKMIDVCNPSKTQSVYKSFKQLGGGIGGGGEPKTDVLFVRNGQKYKCSMKWGESYQLSSAGIQGTVSQLSHVLKSVAMKSSSAQVGALGSVALTLEQISNVLGTGPKTLPQPEIKAKLDRASGLNEELQKILGSRQDPEPDEMYSEFKKAVIREALTGEFLFGKNDDKTANYILTEEKLIPINEQLINKLYSTVFVRLRLKGRGKVKGSDVRLNEIVVTIEPK
jgi:hypothetical protein